MAFNLNKNDEPKEILLTKTVGSSKFNLSKEQPEVSATKNKTWIVVLIGFIIVGSGIWFYSSLSSKQVSSKDTSTEVVVTNPIATTESKALSTSDSETLRKDTSLAGPSVSSVDVVKQATNTDAILPRKHVVNNENSIETLNHKIPVTFTQGSFSIKIRNLILIKNIISYLNNNPRALINVDGYASSDGPLLVNQAISQARANAFKQFLVSKNIEVTRIIATGKGIENPIATNDSNEGRKKNRRVEVTFK